MRRRRPQSSYQKRQILEEQFPYFRKGDVTSVVRRPYTQRASFRTINPTTSDSQPPFDPATIAWTSPPYRRDLLQIPDLNLSKSNGISAILGFDSIFQGKKHAGIVASRVSKICENKGKGRRRTLRIAVRVRDTKRLMRFDRIFFEVFPSRSNAKEIYPAGMTLRASALKFSNALYKRLAPNFFDSNELRRRLLSSR